MNGIDAVTSRRIQTRGADGRITTSKLWNETVATLSLMALGSSAPEIFLAVIELFKKNMHTGELGPSVIVGSAAFNFFIIIAVCIVSIPSDEVRHIEKMPAFITTTIFSAIAYVWLVFILIVSSPEVVDVWEGIVTFLFLPMMIWVSYSVEVGFIGERLGLHGNIEKTRVYPEDASGTGGTDMGLSQLVFAKEMVPVKPFATEHTLDVVILRKGRSEGAISFNYKLEGLCAVAGLDFQEAEGQLEFSKGVEKLELKVKILPKSEQRRECKFLIILDELQGEAEFDPERDGGEDMAIMTVSIEAHANKSLMGNLLSIMRFKSSDWQDQFVTAVYCGGSPEGQKEAGLIDWAYHVIALPWQLLFAFIPPASYGGGWLCFWSSLVGIGMLTAVVSDLAELFGCVLGLADIVTAITFVALGTSMPDLFASKTSAMEDPTADASIVNVTGSNSVNVFLGLGLPWTIAAIYWPLTGRTEEWVQRYPKIAQQMSGAAFVVESQDLGFSVIVYCVCGVVALVLLLMRREYMNCTLGGPLAPKVATGAAFVVLWVIFVVLTSWRALRGADATDSEFAAVIAIAGAVISFSAVVPMVLIVKHKDHVPRSSPVEPVTDSDQLS